MSRSFRWKESGVRKKAYKLVVGTDCPVAQKIIDCNGNKHQKNKEIEKEKKTYGWKNSKAKWKMAKCILKV